MVVGLDAFRLQLNGFGNALRVFVRLSLNSRHVLCQGRLGAGSILHFFFSFFLFCFLLFLFLFSSSVIMSRLYRQILEIPYAFQPVSH